MATESSTTDPSVSQRQGFTLSLDWLAVITALVLIALILLGVITSVPW